MSSLTLDANLIIVPMKAGLRIYSTQGTVELRSKNLAGVHEILQARLDGQYTEKALVSAAPYAQRMTVRRYLRALRDAGAIQTGKKCAARHFGHQTAEVAARLRTRPSEAGDADRRPCGKQASLQCMTWREFASLLVRKADAGTKARRQIYLLTGESWIGESGAQGRDRQGPYSRWLLGREFSPLEKPKIEVFQIENTGALTRKAVFAGKNLGINREVPKALELVRATDIEQAPLAVCQPDSMLCPMDLRWFGIDYDRVAGKVLREMLMRMTMESTDAIRSIGWQWLTSAGSRSGPSLPRVSRADDCLVAASLGELQLGLVERILGQTQGTPVHAEPWDLLQSWSIPDLDYLAQILRQRHSSLQAQVTTRADGLYECTHGGLRTASMLKHKALRDLMVLLTWRTYYGHCAVAEYRPAHECDYRFIAHPEKLRRIFNRVTEKSRKGMAGQSPVFAKICCWGKSAWIGMLHG